MEQYEVTSSKQWKDHEEFSVAHQSFVELISQMHGIIAKEEKICFIQDKDSKLQLWIFPGVGSMCKKLYQEGRRKVALYIGAKGLSECC